MFNLYVFVKECAEENNDEGAKGHSGTMDKNLLSQFYDGGQLFNGKEGLGSNKERSNNKRGPKHTCI